jgi:hypothetical protein
MRFPVFVLAPIAATLVACSDSPTATTPPPPPATRAEIRILRGSTVFNRQPQSPGGPAGVWCADVQASWTIEERAGVGARVVRQESIVVENDGGTLPVVATDMDLPVPASGRAVVMTMRSFCGVQAVDFPMRITVQFTVRDDRGYELRPAADLVLAIR